MDKFCCFDLILIISYGIRKDWCYGEEEIDNTMERGGEDRKKEEKRREKLGNLEEEVVKREVRFGYLFFI